MKNPSFLHDLSVWDLCFCLAGLPIYDSKNSSFQPGYLAYCLIPIPKLWLLPTVDFKHYSLMVLWSDPASVPNP